MENQPPYKIKSIEEMDFSKYQKDPSIKNPYQREFGSKKKTLFSMQKFDAFDSEEDVNGKKRKKHVILSMAEIKDHEMDKKKD